MTISTNYMVYSEALEQLFFIFKYFYFQREKMLRMSFAIPMYRLTGSFQTAVLQMSGLTQEKL